MSDELIADAELGDEAKRFLESDLGRCLVGMAQQEVMAAQEALETVDPNQAEEIRALQNKAKLGRQFDEWLHELVDQGNAALEAFRQQRDT